MQAKIQIWNIDRLVPYARNPRKNDAAVERMCSSIREFGFKIPCLVRSNGDVVDGHLRLKAARKLAITEIPVILCDEWTEAQVKAFRLMVNRSVTWANWDEELLGLELLDLKDSDFDLSLTGFDTKEIDDLLTGPVDDDAANATPPVPALPVARHGDLWLCGLHRVLCGDATSGDAVARLLGDRKPQLMVTDPPYGIELDSEWRDRAGLNGCGPAEASYMKKRTKGHTETAISGDTRADWSEAFELVPSLQIAYVWHASVFTREVLNGLLRIGFLYPQQIIWNKGRVVLTRTHYWYQHEPCQPAGTLVAKVIKQGRWRDHSVIEQVPIETLQAGDLVVSFGRSRIERHGREIRRIGSREYTGNMHEICVGDLTTRATADHQFTIRFDPGKPKYVLHYLMRRGDRWRVGVCGMFNARGFGLAVRLDQEQGEEAWIICAHPDKRSARAAEQVTSCVYGIPTTHWETDRNDAGEPTRDKDDISRIYQQIGSGTISAGVDRLMADRGLKREHPLISSFEEGRFSRTQSRPVRACNLIPAIMQVPVPTHGVSFEWVSITSASFKPVDRVEVWSMDVDQDLHYVADGIVTHNCWYVRKKNAPWFGKAGENSTIWDSPSPKFIMGGSDEEKFDHPTQKPVDLMRRPMLNHIKRGGLVYEPFLGSGTTLAAAEITERVCCGIELDPKYVDVIVQRWQTLSGKKAKLDGDGRTFDEIAEHRLSVVA